MLHFYLVLKWEAVKSGQLGPTLHCNLLLDSGRQVLRILTNRHGLRWRLIATLGHHAHGPGWLWRMLVHHVRDHHLLGLWSAAAEVWGNITLCKTKPTSGCAQDDTRSTGRTL